MATLQELNESVQRINSNLTSYEKQKNDAIEALRSAATSIKDLNKEIGELELDITSRERIASSQNDEYKAMLEAQIKDLEQRKQAAIDERTKLEEKIAAKTDAEKNIRSANEEMDKIILEFASDPRINGNLQEAIMIEYSDKIKETENDKHKQIEDNKKFSLDLKNDKVFGNLVAALVKSYKEYKQYPDVTFGEMRKKKSVAQGKYTRSLDKLQEAISSRPEYEKLNLSREDFEAIIAGPNAEGEYILPTLEDRVASKEKVAQALEDKKTRIIERIKGVLVSERIDSTEEARIDTDIKAATDREQAAKNEITRIQGEIDALKKTFSTADVSAEEKALQDAKDELAKIETAMQDNVSKDAVLEVEIKDLNNQIAAIGFDQTRFEELNKEADVPAELTRGKSSAEKAFEDAKKALKDKGYISEDLYPEMKNYTDQINQFKDADKAVRKAFLDCETNDTPESREALKNAMESYKTASSALTTLPGMEGLTVGNWHDWLVRGLREQNREETLADYYYDNTVNNRLLGVQNEYKRLFKKSHTLDNVFKATEDTLGDVKDMQEAFLRGEDVKYKDVEDGLGKYKNAITKLFDDLKDKGAKGLNKIEDLWGRLQGKLAKFNIFKRIFGSRGGEPAKISGSKSKEEREELKRLEKDFKDKKQAVANIDKDIEEHEKTKLGDKKYQELKALREKEAKAKALVTVRSEKEQKRSDLGIEFAELLDKKTVADDTVTDKQKELDEAKAKGTATPEQQAELSKLEADRDAQEQERQQAEQARIKAEQEKANLKPTRPEVVEDAIKIRHAEGQEIKKKAIEKFKKGIDEER